MIHERWSDLRAALLAINPAIGEAGLEEIRVGTASARHLHRVAAAKRAALFNALPAATPDRVVCSRTTAQAVVLCWLEHMGLYGGGWFAPGCSTERHPAFRGLGSGRRHANDGGAWTSAITQAGSDLAAEGGLFWPPRFATDAVLVVRVEHARVGLPPVDVPASSLLDDPHMRIVAARHAILAAGDDDLALLAAAGSAAAKAAEALPDATATIAAGESDATEPETYHCSRCGYDFTREAGESWESAQRHCGCGEAR